MHWKYPTLRLKCTTFDPRRLSVHSSVRVLATGVENSVQNTAPGSEDDGVYLADGRPVVVDEHVCRRFSETTRRRVRIRHNKHDARRRLTEHQHVTLVHWSCCSREVGGDQSFALVPKTTQHCALHHQPKFHLARQVSTRHDTTRSTWRAIRARCVEPCCSTSSTQPKCMGSTHRTCRDVT